MAIDVSNLSSNWKKLQATLAVDQTTQSPGNELKRKRSQAAPARPRKRSGKIRSDIERRQMDTQIEKKLNVDTAVNAGRSETVEIGRYVALDCEMVGVGPTLPAGGTESALARVSIVNYNGEQVYDSYVLPKEVVTDWRTPVSGIKPVHMKVARTFEEVQEEVASILKDRTVVGHALKHDFKVLLLDHPLKNIRDTSRHGPYRKITGGTPKLSLLASQLLGLEIQDGEHSSLEDARACMLLFRRDKDAFETRKPKLKRKG